MGDVVERRARLRTARRRPGPDRVRARVRDVGEPPQRTWRPHIDWTRWGAVVGIGAGIISLLFTAVATYFGAMVSRDQLEQSQEDAESKSRDQATRVAFWSGKAPNGAARLRLMNRSPDPVTSVNLSLILMIPVPQSAAHREVNASLWQGDMAPCSEVTFELGTLRYQETKKGEWEKPNPKMSAFVMNLHFVDREGAPWRRNSVQLSRLGFDEGARLQPGVWGWDLTRSYGQARAEPVANKASTCGADTGG